MSIVRRITKAAEGRATRGERGSVSPVQDAGGPPRRPTDLGIIDRRVVEDVSARSTDMTWCDELLRWIDDGGADGRAPVRAVRVDSAKNIIVGLRAVAPASVAVAPRDFAGLAVVLREIAERTVWTSR